MLHPNETMPNWPNEKAVDRIRMCLCALHVYGFLTDAERDRVAQRLVKWVKKHPVTKKPIAIYDTDE